MSDEVGEASKRRIHGVRAALHSICRLCEKENNNNGAQPGLAADSGGDGVSGGCNGHVDVSWHVVPLRKVASSSLSPRVFDVDT